jgi:hypothetical protein
MLAFTNCAKNPSHYKEILENVYTGQNSPTWINHTNT